MKSHIDPIEREANKRKNERATRLRLFQAKFVGGYATSLLGTSENEVRRHCAKAYPEHVIESVTET